MIYKLLYAAALSQTPQWPAATLVVESNSFTLANGSHAVVYERVAHGLLVNSSVPVKLNASVDVWLKPHNAERRCEQQSGAASFWRCKVPLYCLRHRPEAPCDVDSNPDATRYFSDEAIAKHVTWYQAPLNLRLAIPDTASTTTPHNDSNGTWPSNFAGFNAVWTPAVNGVGNNWTIDPVRSAVAAKGLYRLGPKLWRAHPASMRAYPWYVLGDSTTPTASVVVCEQAVQGREGFACRALGSRHRSRRAKSLWMGPVTFTPALTELRGDNEPREVTGVSFEWNSTINVEAPPAEPSSSIAIRSFVATRLAILAEEASFTLTMHEEHVARHENSSFWVMTLYISTLITTILLCVISSAWVVWLLTWRWPQVIIPMGRTNVTVLGFLATFAVVLQICSWLFGFPGWIIIYVILFSWNVLMSLLYFVVVICSGSKALYSGRVTYTDPHAIDYYSVRSGSQMMGGHKAKPLSIRQWIIMIVSSCAFWCVFLWMVASYTLLWTVGDYGVFDRTTGSEGTYVVKMVTYKYILLL